jgi:chromosomal replication initiator protein
MTLADIGGHFGGRDHTTVLYAIEKIEKQLAESPEVRTLLDDVKREARARRSGGGA